MSFTIFDILSEVVNIPPKFQRISYNFHEPIDIFRPLIASDHDK